jgi:hypothetical protein
MKKTIKLIAIQLAILASTLTANQIEGTWLLDVDATIQKWIETGELIGEIDKKEKILRNELFNSPITCKITDTHFEFTTGDRKEQFLCKTEKEGEGWVLFSVETKEGKIFKLCTIQENGTIHATKNTSGDLKELRAEPLVDVYTRK